MIRIKFNKIINENNINEISITTRNESLLIDNEQVQETFWMVMVTFNDNYSKTYKLNKDEFEIFNSQLPK